MAKGKYNPIAVFKEDPLAALKAATDDGRQTGLQEVTVSTAQASHPSQTAIPDDLIERDQNAAKTSRATTKPLAASLNTSRNTVYLYPEDLTKLRQLSGYVSTEHGIRANDSMIVRAALSLLEPDARLLHALRETELLDRRRRSRPE